jgi:hypothetical protein
LLSLARRNLRSRRPGRGTRGFTRAGTGLRHRLGLLRRRFTGERKDIVRRRFTDWSWRFPDWSRLFPDWSRLFPDWSRLFRSGYNCLGFWFSGFARTPVGVVLPSVCNFETCVTSFSHIDSPRKEIQHR